MRQILCLQLTVVFSDSGWLQGVRHCYSPNYDARPADTKVDLLVVHSISLPPGKFGTGAVDAFFCNALDCSRHPYFEQLLGLRVSAHFFIDRCGELTQFVSTQQRAWHAGVSKYCGRERCNDFSIGVELEGEDDRPYTQSQYKRLAELSLDIMNNHPAVRPDRIVGHSDIAPGRKTDPGEAFEWAYFNSLLSKRLQGRTSWNS